MLQLNEGDRITEKHPSFKVTGKTACAIDTDLSGNELSYYNHTLPWPAETSQTAKPKANRRRIKGPQRKSYKKINIYRKFSFEPIEPNFIILYMKKKPLEVRQSHFQSYLFAKTKRAILTRDPFEQRWISACYVTPNPWDFSMRMVMQSFTRFLAI